MEGFDGLKAPTRRDPSRSIVTIRFLHSLNGQHAPGGA